MSKTLKTRTLWLGSLGALICACASMWLTMSWADDIEITLKRLPEKVGETRVMQDQVNSSYVMNFQGKKVNESTMICARWTEEILAVSKGKVTKLKLTFGESSNKGKTYCSEKRYNGKTVFVKKVDKDYRVTDEAGKEVKGVFRMITLKRARKVFDDGFEELRLSLFNKPLKIGDTVKRKKTKRLDFIVYPEMTDFKIDRIAKVDGVKCLIVTFDSSLKRDTGQISINVSMKHEIAIEMSTGRVRSSTAKGPVKRVMAGSNMEGKTSKSLKGTIKYAD